ncbi:MAG: permease-like cell division protein FtsX [Candidatus Accumulibacter sp.]|jgi:cell division transport system permease protein|nr:permease-like cell division protein FtsX [Accumulibacter sp.]
MRRFLTQHASAFGDAVRKLFASPLGTILSLIVIGTALALPAASGIILDNLRDLAGGAPKAQQISLFMASSADRRAFDEIELRLRMAHVGNWRFVPRDEALERLKAIEGVPEILASLPKNPLPDAFIVEPEDVRPEMVENLAKTFSSWPEVEHVQLDSEWVRRLDVFLRIGRLMILMLASLFGGALIIVTFNTIRLQILAQADEIEIARLIGATNAFVRRPFQYFGFLQGLLGGLFAAALILLGAGLLSSTLDELVALYGGRWAPHGLDFALVGRLTGIGALLGWLGAQLSVAVHLKKGA